MDYVPNTDKDIASMLRTLGMDSIEECFEHIPKGLRLDGPLALEDGLDELRLVRRMRAMSERNADECSSFLGGGAYRHFIPSVVTHLAGREEFYTAYTPYQPEISQGTLQSIYEYQTLMCMLTGMDASNASVYDGATAAAEATLMAQRVTKRNRVLVSRTVNPEYRAVIKTYAEAGSREVAEVPFNERGTTDPGALSSLVDDETACVVLQSPNYFGLIEEPGLYEKAVHGSGALLVGSFSEPLAFGMIRPPGDYGADIAAGEGQSLGMGPGYGGPFLGILGCSSRFVRNLPGRIVGKTVDMEGRTAFVLTLTAREQHIRRERSTSNICTNQGLCALTAAVYLSALGADGLRQVAALNHDRAEYARKKIQEIRGAELAFDGPVFNEFTIRVPGNLHGLYERCLEERIIPGIPLENRYGELGDCMLVTVTEMNSREEIDTFCGVLGKILS